MNRYIEDLDVIRQERPNKQAVPAGASLWIPPAAHFMKINVHAVTSKNACVASLAAVA